MRQRIVTATVYCSLIFAAACIGLAQSAPAPAKAKAGKTKAARPPLFLREEWKQTPANDEHPVTQESVANPNLELKLYGPSSKEIQLTGSAGDESNPIHLWTGMCTSPCAVGLRDKNNYADLTGLSRIRWNTKVSGFHAIRPLLKLADGTLLVGDHTHGSTVDWLMEDFSLSEVRWRRLDPERVVTVGDWVANPDLSKVDEVGFADLMPGSGHGQGGWSDVGLIEVYGKAVKR
jgi:hypothetical protein